MKPAPFALLVLAVLFATAWPISSAIGAATATAVARAEVQPAGCGPDAAAELGPALGLPPGHPPVPLRLPPGHPPIGPDLRLPPGHPPLSPDRSPGVPSVPSSPGPLFQEPLLLTI